MALSVFFLSVLQGVSEFLPISSSGHLVIAERLLGISEPGLRLEICLHLGTLVSIVLFYRKTLLSLFGKCFSKSSPARIEGWMFVAKIVLSALPAVLAYFLFPSQIESLAKNVKMVGALLMFTGAVLCGTRYMPKGSKGISFARALFMGVGQAIALLPGVSRSGTTLAFARGAGADPEKSAEFSFLMSAPLIAGGFLLELKSALSGASAAGDVSWPMLAVGMAVSAAVGYLSLAFLVKTLKGRFFWLFGPYCFVAGLCVLLFL